MTIHSGWHRCTALTPIPLLPGAPKPRAEVNRRFGRKGGGSETEGSRSDGTIGTELERTENQSNDKPMR